MFIKIGSFIFNTDNVTTAIYQPESKSKRLEVFFNFSIGAGNGPAHKEFKGAEAESVWSELEKLSKDVTQ